MVKIWVLEGSQRSFLKDVSHGIMVQEGSCDALQPPPPFAARLQVYQDRLRDLLKAFDPALEGVRGI